MISRGRLLQADGSQLIAASRRERAWGRRIPSSTIAASEQAQKILHQARTEAARLVAVAEQQAADARLRAQVEGRADGVAAVAARAIALSAWEAAAEERQRERLIDLARALAERLLGEQLRLHPETVVALAEQVLAEGSGARRVRLVAHPDDLPHLRAELSRIAGATRTVELVADEKRARGELRMETEIGTLDAELAPQLARLAAHLRESGSS